MKVLIIAYSFYPEKNVGAIRTTYWAEELAKLEGVDVEVITKHEINEQVNYKFITVEPERKGWMNFLIQDEGLGWKKDILEYYKRSNQKEVYDYVIISGGPFLHFSLGRILKKKGIVKKVILDYRDPFSFNPRFGDSKIKIAIKKCFELNITRGANMITSVNEMCLDYVSTLKKKQKEVLPNGFDERFLTKSIATIQKHSSIVYPGKFYWHPHELFKILNKLSVDLHHCGSQMNLENTREQTHYHYEGVLKQKDLQEFLFKGKIGLVFLSSTPFESTTKIFDYLALNMAVLIITRGEKEVGAMGELLKDYPNVYWAREHEEDIEKGILFLQNMKLQEVYTEQFSRSSSFNTLLKLLNYEK